MIFFLSKRLRNNLLNGMCLYQPRRKRNSPTVIHIKRHNKGVGNILWPLLRQLLKAAVETEEARKKRNTIDNHGDDE